MGRAAGLVVAGALLAACAAPGGGATVQEAAEAAAAAEVAPGAKTVAQEIDAMEQAWAGAVRRKDRAELERLMAPEFVLTGPAGETTPRAEWLDNLALMDVRSYAVRVTEVQAAGDTAAALVEGEWTVSRNGGPMRRDAFKLKDTWVRRGGAWTVTQRVRLNPPPGG